MIELPSSIGRAVVVVSALLTVIAFTLAGYAYARGQEVALYGNFIISEGGQITPLEGLYSLLGLGIGFIFSGAVFGAIATLYVIRDNLRRISIQMSGNPISGHSPDPSATRRERREPSLR